VAAAEWCVDEGVGAWERRLQHPSNIVPWQFRVIYARWTWKGVAGVLDVFETALAAKTALHNGEDDEDEETE
jgi:hypothetical protein